MDKDLVDYFISQTDGRFDKIDERFKEVDKKLNTLLEFKWKIGGAVILMSFFATVIMQFLFKNII